ncbi:MAG: Uma2 family endonuclease [Chloroflexota bacterium]|nr:Uma2 family endonuclease [Chloroflexota bacterium]
MALQPPQAMETAPSVEGDYLTFEDFLKAYADVRAEWVDGKVELVSVIPLHQTLLIFLTNLLSTFLDFKPIGMLYSAGVLVRLAQQKRGREPDLLVALNEHRDRVQRTFVEGAPDLCVELVSEESVERDYVTKLGEYEQAGVPEYWLFDALHQVANIYVLGDDGKYTVQPRDAQGRLVARILPGLKIVPEWLWSEHRPQVRAIVKQVETMLAE